MAWEAAGADPWFAMGVVAAADAIQWEAAAVSQADRAIVAVANSAAEPLGALASHFVSLKTDGFLTST